jgi:anti-sigma factor RsiW
MTCRETIALLADYLDATLSPASLTRLERHLRDCDECRAYLATYRRTVSATFSAARIEMPPEMRRRLAEFLVEQLRGSV